MSERAKRNESFIRLYYASTPRQRRALLQIASRDQVLFLVEIIYNALCGSLPLDDSCTKKLKRKRAVCRSLAFDKKLSWKSKRNLIFKTQTGGVLGALAGVAASYLFDKVLQKITGSNSKKGSTPPPPQPTSPEGEAASLVETGALGR